MLRRCQGYAPFEGTGFAAKALKGRNILAMGEAHRNGNANPCQALKGRNSQAQGKGRGAGIWPFFGLAPLSTIMAPLRAWASLRGSLSRLKATWHKTLFLGKTLVENQLEESK